MTQAIPRPGGCISTCYLIEWKRAAISSIRLLDDGSLSKQALAFHGRRFALLHLLNAAIVEGGYFPFPILFDDHIGIE